MKFIWIDYLIFAWFGLFMVVILIEAISNKIIYWTVPAYIIVWGILMIIKTFIKKKKHG